MTTLIVCVCVAGAVLMGLLTAYLIHRAERASGWMSMFIDRQEAASRRELDARRGCKPSPLWANDNPNPSPDCPPPVVRTRP